MSDAPRPGDDRYRVLDAARVGIAAIEYHVHAWDLRRSAGGDHRAGDAVLLADVWSRHLERVLSAPPPEDEPDPWRALLQATGRDPAWGVTDTAR